PAGTCYRRDLPEARRTQHDHGRCAHQAGSGEGDEGRAGRGGRGRVVPRPLLEGRSSMPKMRTHRGAANRLRLTATGKVTRSKATGNQIHTKKSGARKSRITRA